jgi:hypothetical protein
VREFICVYREDKRSVRSKQDLLGRRYAVLRDQIERIEDMEDTMGNTEEIVKEKEEGRGEERRRSSLQSQEAKGRGSL